MKHHFNIDAKRGIWAVLLPFILCAILFATVVIILIDLLQSRRYPSVKVLNSEEKILWEYERW